MIPGPAYFFCGVGGSGMTPLALIMRARGAEVAGSDRAHDQGRSPDRFARLADAGVTLQPQDGSGVTRPDQVLVVSAAIEETVPDVRAARAVGARVITRAELLADLFNAAPVRIGVGGTSGKSTTTAMLGWILAAAGQDPTVINGADMLNVRDASGAPASVRVGAEGCFVSEVDESDGSIALYAPTIAVVTNISFDHKPLEALRPLFSDFAGKARSAILNLDNPETAALAARLGEPVLSFAVDAPQARIGASGISPAPFGVSFDLVDRASGRSASVRLKAPGRHNVANALAAAAAALAAGVPLEASAAALSEFAGVRRRMEVAGEAGGVTVIDDFAHNPDKITAALAALREFPGRLLVIFQPHGFGPIKLMRAELAEAFARGLAPSDRLAITEPAYFGGTADRSVTGADLARDIAALGADAVAAANRDAAADAFIASARPGDRLVVFGARDESLSDFAKDLVRRLGAQNPGGARSKQGSAAS